LRKFLWRFIKRAVLILVVLSSGLAIRFHRRGADFDPVREIQELKQENRRDDALDMAKFFSQNQNRNSMEIKQLETELEYTDSEKIKSFLYDGVIKGEVHDTYSGLGAISSDLCLVGDIRDLTIQSYKYLTNSPDFDRLIMLLSAAGIGFSTTPYMNGCDALAKNTVKYVKKVPASMNRGVLKRFLSLKISVKDSERIWDLLKKTSGPSREP